MPGATVRSVSDQHTLPTGRTDDVDATLLELNRASDTTAFSALLQRWWSPLVRYSTRIVGDSESAEDVTQEAFIRLWEQRAKWRPRSSVRAILYTIVRNLALNQRKSKASQVQRLFGQPVDIVSGLPSAQDRLEGDEFGSALAHAISRLPARQREVLTLSRFDGMSRSEIAEVTGLSPQTVANYMAAALSSLRATLGPFLSDR